MKKRKGFSLIEVLIAIAIIIMTGVAVISLNTAGLKIANEAVFKLTAYNIADQAVGYVRLCKKAERAGLPCNPGISADTTYYVYCDEALTTGCVASTTSKSIMVEKTRYTTTMTFVTLSPTQTRATVNVSWGEKNNTNKNLKFSQDI